MEILLLAKDNLLLYEGDNILGSIAVHSPFLLVTSHPFLLAFSHIPPPKTPHKYYTGDNKGSVGYEDPNSVREICSNLTLTPVLQCQSLHGRCERV